MDLRRKLGQLPPPSGEKRASAPEPDSSNRETTLAELRARMAKLLEQGALPMEPAPLSNAWETTLPFVVRATEFGEFSWRSELLAPSHHVGRIPTSAAHAANAALLALLALDPGLSGVDPRGALYIDTETTGLGGSGAIAFLIGMAWFEGESLRLEQVLLRSPAEEKAGLRVVAERIHQASLLVSYNGKSFDLPLLATRAVMNREPSLPVRPHLDLLHVARRLHRTRLGACKLTTLESEILGFERGPDIQGGDIPARYSHFLRTGDEEALRDVVEHNAFDVVSMAALVGLYGEPLGGLHEQDLVALARTFHRAGDATRADEAIEHALQRGAGVQAIRARGEIAKARGDRARALADFETLVVELDDSQARLELSKLYEHYAKEPLKALNLALLGTSEAAEAQSRRVSRLSRKVERAQHRSKTTKRS
ncbi:MAG: ribonuclease H-like domain-containing protein [Polyangiaceae bacterium]|nr:ribonuclease H-like domain-containing protein [Polyangiaceae bacterium]